MASARPQPAALAILAGQPELRPQRYAERNLTLGDLVEADSIVPPAGLQKETREFWNIAVPSLLRMKVIALTDLGELERTFRAYDNLILAEKALRKFQKSTDLEYLSDKWIMRRAKLNRIYTDSLSSYVKLSSRFGLNPSDRNRWPKNQSDSSIHKNEDPLDVILAGTEG